MSVIKRDEKGRFAPTVRGQRNRLHVRFTDKTFRRVSNLAVDNDTSVAVQVEKLVEKGLESASPLLAISTASKNLVLPAVVGFLGAVVGVLVAVSVGII